MGWMTSAFRIANKSKIGLKNRLPRNQNFFFYGDGIDKRSKIWENRRRNVVRFWLIIGETFQIARQSILFFRPNTVLDRYIAGTSRRHVTIVLVWTAYSVMVLQKIDIDPAQQLHTTR
ncbi:hypothetical protein LAZ67_20000225 [Cordylochernes scorpioides]|uniref:Uncharacterized protein n=1 Tax=Cordylochernes scorpioides TaxID=51811 RepID=A0ABY6LL95_9ARAC|nr:hypothetical protein LAZ67_20000225 [Cordylochernes scorpioides]